MLCPNCNNPINPEDKFCKQCGFNMLNINNNNCLKLAYISLSNEILNENLSNKLRTKYIKGIARCNLEIIQGKVVFKYEISNSISLFDRITRGSIRKMELLSILYNLSSSIIEAQKLEFNYTQMYLDLKMIYIDREYNTSLILLPLNNRMSQNSANSVINNILEYSKIDPNEGFSLEYINRIRNYINSGDDNISNFQRLILDIINEQNKAININKQANNQMQVNKNISENRDNASNLNIDINKMQSTDISQDEGTTFLQEEDEGTTILQNEVRFFITRLSNNEKIEINKDSFFVGSSAKNDYTVRGNTAISRRHCEFIKDNLDDMYIIDLNSTNGTFINGVRIQKNEKMKINSNDQIKIADELYTFNKEED